MKVRSRLVGAAAAVVVCSFLFIFCVYRAQLIEFVQDGASTLRENSYSRFGFALLITLMSIPPMLGFTLTTTSCGFIYGFPDGIPIAVGGAFVGALCCYGLFRYGDFARFLRLSPSKQEKYQTIQEALSQGGISMILLIRMSPIPWQFSNLLVCFVSSITFTQYAVTTFIASFKICLDVWLGSQFANLSDPNLPPSARRVALVTMVASMAFLGVVAVWLYRLTMAKAQKITRGQNLARDSIMLEKV
ncbi:snare associated Golgi protein-domain-containing protein [Radiomyces spectabilis]|uniref:snare associated Golgi protein-domain-containing protein n=1 Tax=Radiomyces spectabilis TaxID=64574 RepID=UPI00221F6B5F|nr:snare associated Golgi protein-domain-containing protein [Radiomyces spectabilis]KAI8381459.1 snare associated Golgi protein-domain-containing protein [Radiomyces spectabilis]